MPDPYSDHLHLSADGAAVEILDQSLLPNQEVYLRLTESRAMFDAIARLQVRGAPAIGIFAAYSLYVIAQSLPERDFLPALREQAAYLESSRPTAVNLGWALRRMLCTADRASTQEKTALLPLLLAEALAIHSEDISACRTIADHGLSLLRPGWGVLTHCNAGELATSRYGTALGPLLLAQERGVDLHIFADETRPLLQGARLTCYELHRAGCDVTLICDNMAATVMKNGWVQACFVGCDRIAANGDTANKIGTSGVAILAQHYHIPFYVLGPTSTIDLDCPTGADIRIELRPEREISENFYQRPMAPAGVKCYNPAFDVTDAALICGVITEQGILRPPYAQSLAQAVAAAQQRRTI